MKKAFPILLIVFGIVFLGAGGYTFARGVDAKDQVRDELIAQRITTPDDATIPGVRVDSARTAQSMADIIAVHALESTDGRTYSEMGRFLAASGGDTNVEKDALKGADGKPIANPLRNVAFQASSLRTSLYTSVMAFNVADLVRGLGVMIGALGLALAGLGVVLASLAIPSFARRVHVQPLVSEAHPHAA